MRICPVCGIEVPEEICFICKSLTYTQEELEEQHKETGKKDFCSKQNFLLPKEIDEAIYKIFDGVHAPRGEGYGKRTDDDCMYPNEYLGTYFPLSFTEGYCAIADMLKNDIIYNMYDNKDKIKILDIGSGQGGYSLGTIWAFKASFPDKQIFVLAVDGNSEYLMRLKRLHEKLLTNREQYTIFKCNHNFIIDDFGLNFPEKVFQQKYDLIISSKFLLELFDENKPEMNPWKLFVKESESLLESGGFLLINEVERPMVKLEDGTGKHFVTDELKKGLRGYLMENNQLKICFPIPCSLLFPHKCESKYCKPFREYDVISNYRRMEPWGYGRMGKIVEEHPSTVINFILTDKETYDQIYKNEVIPERFPVTFPVFADGVENKVCNVGYKSTCKEDSHYSCNNLYVFNDICTKYQKVN